MTVILNLLAQNLRCIFISVNLINSQYYDLRMHQILVAIIPITLYPCSSRIIVQHSIFLFIAVPPVDSLLRKIGARIPDEYTNCCAI